MVKEYYFVAFIIYFDFIYLQQHLQHTQRQQHLDNLSKAKICYKS